VTAKSSHRIARIRHSPAGGCGAAADQHRPPSAALPGGCPAKCPRDAAAAPPFSAWGSDPRPHVPRADPHQRAERRSPESAPTAKASSSLNPYQMNDASSNKAQYHNINNIYFRAKLQPGLLIPVIKENGSSVRFFASLEPTVRVLKPWVIFFFFIAASRGGGSGSIPGAVQHGPSPQQSHVQGSRPAWSFFSIEIKKHQLLKDKLLLRLVPETSRIKEKGTSKKEHQVPLPETTCPREQQHQAASACFPRGVVLPPGFRLRLRTAFNAVCHTFSSALGKEQGRHPPKPRAGQRCPSRAPAGSSKPGAPRQRSGHDSLCTPPLPGTQGRGSAPQGRGQEAISGIQHPQTPKPAPKLPMAGAKSQRR